MTKAEVGGGTMNPTERILSALRNHGHEPKQTGAGWSCRCPVHDDNSPSLSINTGDDGRALVHCHAGCTSEAIVAAVGLRPVDLFADDPSRRNGYAPRTRSSVTVTKPPGKSARNSGFGDGDAKTFPTARDAAAELERRHGSKSAWWVYHNAGGVEVGMVIRWNTTTGKDIRPVSRKADGSGWIIGGMPTPRPLYGLPALLLTPAGSRVYITEGEKAAGAARAVGLVATTSPHGSKSASKAHWSAVAGREVVILPDHDVPGERYAADVARRATIGGAKSVRIVRLVELWAGMPEGGDMADFVEHRGGDADAIRAEIEGLAESTGATTHEPVRIDGAPVIVRMADVEPREVDWLWKDRIPRGRLTLLAGRPGEGKSMATMDWAARVTTGSPWPDGLPCPLGSVVLVAGEDDAGETIRPRLDAHGADSKRVYQLARSDADRGKGRIGGSRLHARRNRPVGEDAGDGP